MCSGGFRTTWLLVRLGPCQYPGRGGSDEPVHVECRLFHNYMGNNIYWLVSRSLSTMSDPPGLHLFPIQQQIRNMRLDPENAIMVHPIMWVLSLYDLVGACASILLSPAPPVSRSSRNSRSRSRSMCLPPLNPLGPAQRLCGRPAGRERHHGSTDTLTSHCTLVGKQKLN